MSVAAAVNLRRKCAAHGLRRSPSLSLPPSPPLPAHALREPPRHGGKERAGFDGHVGQFHVCVFHPCTSPVGHGRSDFFQFSKKATTGYLHRSDEAFTSTKLDETCRIWMNCYVVILNYQNIHPKSDDPSKSWCFFSKISKISCRAIARVLDEIAKKRIYGSKKHYIGTHCGCSLWMALDPMLLHA